MNRKILKKTSLHQKHVWHDSNLEEKDVNLNLIFLRSWFYEKIAVEFSKRDQNKVEVKFRSVSIQIGKPMR